MTKKNYCVTSPAWGVHQIGLEDTPSNYWLERFWVLVQFLQAHNLTIKELFASKEQVTEDAKLMAEDLTETGLAVLKTGLSRWESANDGYHKYTKSGFTVVPLENALKRVLALKSE